ncbi:hypothetical protein ACLKA6_000169 [Drosophila palustris]
MRVEKARIVAQVQIEGQVRQATIDTGTTRSFVSEAAASQLGSRQLRDVRAKVSMADGSRATVCKALIATVQLGKKCACIPFLVLSTDVDDVILGIDFLSQGNAPVPESRKLAHQGPKAGTLRNVHKDPSGGNPTQRNQNPKAGTSREAHQDPKAGDLRNVYKDPSGGNPTQGNQNPKAGTSRKAHQDPKAGTPHGEPSQRPYPFGETTTEVCAIAIPPEPDPHVNEADDDDPSETKPRQEEEPELEPWVRDFLEQELAQFETLTGVTHIAEHAITMKDDRPIKQRYYPKNPAMQRIIDQQVDVKEQLPRATQEPS